MQQELIPFRYKEWSVVDSRVTKTAAQVHKMCTRGSSEIVAYTCTLKYKHVQTFRTIYSMCRPDPTEIQIYRCIIY